MADSDNTPTDASGSPQPGDGPGDAPSPRDAGGPTDLPQRHHLPMRKASTLPDLSQHGDEEDGHAAGSTTRTLPTAERSDGEEGGGVETSAVAVPTQAASEIGHDGERDGGAGAASTAGRDGGAETPAVDATTHAASIAGRDGGALRSDDDGGPGPDGHPGEEPRTDTGALSIRPPDREAARRAAVRDNAATAKPALPRFLQVVVALFFPVIVVAAAIRAVATSSFLWLEYHRPGFPADSYGFSLDDRMTYGSYALDYVLNFAPARYLGGLRTPEGEPLFLESEVGHMADVKGVLGLSFFVALVMFVLTVLACVYLARRYKGGIRRALFAGAVLTLTGAVVLTVLAVLAWETFFTQVHALFFADGTWTFRVDDTLIRLFPEQFWTDSAVTIAVLVLGATIVTLIATWPTKARRERSRLAQEEAQIRYREALEAS